MKNILKSLLLLAALSFVITSCFEEPFDVQDGGSKAANLYATQSVKYFTGDNEFKIDLEKIENEGVTVSTINYTVHLKSVAGEADASGSVDGNTAELAFTLNDLLTTLPVGGNVLTENDLDPGDTFTFGYTITLSDGRILNPPASTLVTVLCPPAPGDYTVKMYDSYGDGWQTDDGNGGNGLTVTLEDGAGNESEVEVGMCSPYLASDYACIDGDGYSAEAVITIPDGTKIATWFFPGDAYGEISFDIYSPTDELLFSYSTSDDYAGELPIINCAN